MPAKPILVISGNYHLGDNPGLFQDATYIGHQLVLPLRISWIDDKSDVMAFHFTTHDIETWGQRQGHRVSINGTEIGRLKDASDHAGLMEHIKIEIGKPAFLSLLNGDDNFTLAVELEKQADFPGLADDFVLTRIATSANLAVTIGWKDRGPKGTQLEEELPKDESPI
ncbi:hypothetical protein [Singulisphaera sp. PoT]|uniref:hypothetical protein n=1 Tax=Singulisphaera sp. PoT TaxID=3411797 RepID=UPI003BF599F7